MTVVCRLAASMKRLASWRLLGITGVVFAVFAALLFASSAPFSISHVQAQCGQAPPDVRFFTSANDVREFMVGCGQAGRSAYRNLQLADLLYPAVFALFMASALAMALSRIVRKESLWLAAAALPLIGAGFDYLENAAAWITIFRFPERSGAAAYLLGVASVAKQTVSWVAGLLLLTVLGYTLARSVTKRRSKRVTVSTK